MNTRPGGHEGRNGSNYQLSNTGEIKYEFTNKIFKMDSY